MNYNKYFKYNISPFPNFIKIADFKGNRTFSGTYNDDTSVFTISANDTVWGGIKLLMFK